MDQFQIKRGDTSPALRYRLLPDTINLAGASVRFQMRPRGGATVVDAPATIIEAIDPPTVQYDWQAGDTAQAGLYEGEFRVEYADGTVETFPNSSFIRVCVFEDVPDA